jgi:hypothetical protein
MILDQALQLLVGGQALTIPELVAHIPELVGQPHGEEVLRLLLRLDKRFYLHDDRWLLREGVSDPRQHIRKAIKAYFQTHPRGELLKHLIPAVAVQTGQPPAEIEKVILQSYRHVGSMILNIPKERT